GETFPARLKGALALLCVLPAALLMTDLRGSVRVLAQYATLGLASLTLIEVCWAALDPAVPQPWLHRTGLLLAACSLLTLASGVALGRLLPIDADWLLPGRHATTVLGALALALVAGVLGQEALLRQQGLPLPMLESVLLVVAGGLVLLMIAGIVFAVSP